MKSTALAKIVVGVVVECRKARSPWLDFLWRPISVFVGTPSAVPWTQAAVTASVASPRGLLISSRRRMFSVINNREETFHEVDAPKTQ